MTDNRTQELREKLAKYGVEWDERSCPDYFFDTAWKYAKGAYASFTESSDGTTFMILRNVTPEQAIAATLGSERDEIYNAGFDNGIKATLHQLDGLLVKTDSAVEIQAWVDEQWKERES